MNQLVYTFGEKKISMVEDTYAEGSETTETPDPVAVSAVGGAVGTVIGLDRGGFLGAITGGVIGGTVGYISGAASQGELDNTVEPSAENTGVRTDTADAVGEHEPTAADAATETDEDAIEIDIDDTSDDADSNEDTQGSKNGIGEDEKVAEADPESATRENNRDDVVESESSGHGADTVDDGEGTEAKDSGDDVDEDTED